MSEAGSEVLRARGDAAVTPATSRRSSVAAVPRAPSVDAPAANLSLSVRTPLEPPKSPATPAQPVPVGVKVSPAPPQPGIPPPSPQAPLQNPPSNNVARSPISPQTGFPPPSPQMARSSPTAQPRPQPQLEFMVTPIADAPPQRSPSSSPQQQPAQPMLRAPEPALHASRSPSPDAPIHETAFPAVAYAAPDGSSMQDGLQQPLMPELSGEVLPPEASVGYVPAQDVQRVSSPSPPESVASEVASKATTAQQPSAVVDNTAELEAMLARAREHCLRLQERNESLERLLQNQVGAGDAKVRGLKDELAKRAALIKKLESTGGQVEQLKAELKVQKVQLDKATRHAVALEKQLAAEKRKNAEAAAAQRAQASQPVQPRHEPPSPQPYHTRQRSSLSYQQLSPPSPQSPPQPSTPQQRHSITMTPLSVASKAPTITVHPAAATTSSNPRQSMRTILSEVTTEPPPPPLPAAPLPPSIFNIESEADAVTLARHVLAKAQVNSDVPVMYSEEAVMVTARRLLYEYAQRSPLRTRA